MDKKTKKQWVAALRSGEYEQGTSWLRREKNGTEQFCCLGVLCDLVEPGQWRSGDGAGCWRNGSGKDADSCLPRPSVQERFGLDKKVDRTGSSTTVADELACMNDDGISFADIAKWIEKTQF